MILDLIIKGFLGENSQVIKNPKILNSDTYGIYSIKNQGIWKFSLLSCQS